MKLFVTLC